MSRDRSDREPASARTGTAQPESAVPLQERRRHALRDLDELSEQVEAGELDEATAERLRAAYRAELEAVDQELQRSESHSSPQARSSRRAMAGALLLIGAFTVIIILASQALRSEGGTSQQADDVAAIDPSTLEQMEELVAAQPDSPGMRLALADFYFGQGDYLSAIDHYLALASMELSPQEESQTLGRIGWMAYSTGQTDPAVEYLTASLDADPDNIEGKLYLGIVRLFGLEDAAGAIPLFEEVLALPELGVEIRAEVGDLLEQARTATESP